MNIVLKFFLISLLTYFLNFSQILFASENHNIRLNSESFDFGNRVFTNKLKGCGNRKYQKGLRSKQSVLYLTGENFVIQGGTFDCSLQNTIFVQSAKNLVINNVTASRGSDNPIEIRDSFVIVKNSIFKDSFNNKCVETENGIVVFYKNIFSNCRNGFDIELTLTNFYTTNKKLKNFNVKLHYSAVVFLENKFLNIRDDGFHCHDRRKNGDGNVFLFLKNNTFSGKAGYTFRKFGKKRDCLKVINISNELESAIISNDNSRMFDIIRKNVEQLM